MKQPVKIPCSCGEVMEVQVSNPPRTINMESVSLVIIEHEGQVVCTKCGTVSIPVLGQLQGVAFALVPIPPEKQRSVIIPGNNIGNGGIKP